MAIYTVAIILNRSFLPILVSFLLCELFGRLTMFQWAYYYNNGIVLYSIWGVVYAMGIQAYLRSKGGINKNSKKRLLAISLMIVFQIAMVFDCTRSEGSATYMYTNYEYIIVVIHCIIAFAFIERANVIRFMGNIPACFGGIIHYIRAIKCNHLYSKK